MNIELREITGEDIDKIFGLRITGWSKGDGYNSFGLEGPGVREARLTIRHDGKMFYEQKAFDKDKALKQALDCLNEFSDSDSQYWLLDGVLWCGNLDENTGGKVCDVSDIESYEVYQDGDIEIHGDRLNEAWILTPRGPEF